MLEAEQLWVDYFDLPPGAMLFRSLLAVHLKSAINDNDRWRPSILYTACQDMLEQVTDTPALGMNFLLPTHW